LKAEDDVLKAVGAAEAKLKDYHRQKEANRSDDEKRALAVELSMRRNALQQRMNQVLPGIQSQIRALTMQQVVLSQQATAGQYGNAARGSIPLSNVGASYQMNMLGQQIAQLQIQAAEMTAEVNELNRQVNELTPRTVSVQPKTKPGGKPPASAVDQKRKALQDAIAEARKVVDETTKAYATLGEDSQVKSALDNLKRPLSSKPVLGPSRKMLTAVTALERAEAYAANPDDSSGSPKSPSVYKRKSRSAKTK
jgi:hypothetical protein